MQVMDSIVQIITDLLTVLLSVQYRDNQKLLSFLWIVYEQKERKFKITAKNTKTIESDKLVR